MRRLLLLGLLMSCLALVAITQSAAAQEDPNDDIRALFPEGEPGDLDLTEEDARWQQFVEVFGASTAVEDFGTGSSFTGPCGGQAYSYDGDGNLIDVAFDLGDDNPPIDLMSSSPAAVEQAFTSGNPFKVDTAGVVVYFGFYPFEGDGPRNHEWSITTEGISLDSGGDDNPDGNNRNTGVVDLGEQLPFGFSFKAKVEANIESNLPPCFGQGHVEFEGPAPLTSIPGLIGGVGLLGGIFGLLFNARPAMTYKAGGSL